ncbi:hypothetical protein [Paenibacillus sp. y28]|uniref:hypothetical protein n=1 Tax=Paenibacillus sp. y28 TaxID=3129110 RepID=UPI003017D086
MNSIINRKKLAAAIAGMICIVGLLVAGYALFIRGTPASPDFIAIRYISIADGALAVRGTTTSSAAGYSGYTYRIEDHQLFIQIKYTRTVSLFHPTGDFNISIRDQLASIRQVYVQGKDTADTKLIWEK